MKYTDYSMPVTLRKERQQPKKAAFLGAMAQLGNITRAAKLAGINPCTHYKWLKADSTGAYRQAFDVAMEEAVDHLEAEARRRAVEGVEKPVYQGGRMVGTIREYSDTLLIFLLKGARPEKYREHSNVDVTTGGKELHIVIPGLCADGDSSTN